MSLVMDIVTRLREHDPTDRQARREARIELHTLLHDAATEIERLRSLVHYVAEAADYARDTMGKPRG
jgi:hypothetical protein